MTRENEFDDDEPIETAPLWRKKRYLVVLMAFLGFFNVYSLRVNLSVAIVAMTEEKTVKYDNGTIGVERDFDWDSKQKGMILSSFFYGYITTQFIGGYVANKIGGNLVFGCGIGMTALLTLLTPLAAKAHLYVFLGVRILEGIFEGVTFPCIHAIWSNWAPPMERSRMASIAFAGTYAGTVIVLPSCGLLAEAYGWESLFYVFGGIGVLWFIAWIIIVKKSPLDDNLISLEERNYIMKKLQTRDKADIPSPPWKAILTSPPVWAIVASHFCENWGFYLMLTQLPTFLGDALGFHLEKTGFLSAVPYLVNGLSLPFAGYLADKLQEHNILTTTQVRRYFNCGAFLGQTVFLLLAAFLMTPTMAIVFITFSLGLGSFAWSGFMVNHLDIAPQYASILMGFSNTWATIPGIVAPMIAGYLTPDGTKEQWRNVFFISAGVYLIGCVIYWTFVSGEVQPWARMEPIKKAETRDNPSDKNGTKLAYTNEGLELKDE